MSWRNDLPDRNRYGLIIPPTPATSERRLSPAREKGRTFSSWHHLYWPKKVFVAAGQLACQFRSHPFNVIALPRFQHDEYHTRYDEAVVRRYPGEIMPSDDVMAAFLDEANLLYDLDVSLGAIDKIDDAMYEGTVKHIDQVEEDRLAHMERVANSLGVIVRGEIEIVSLSNLSSKIQLAQGVLQGL